MRGKAAVAAAAAATCNIPAATCNHRTVRGELTKLNAHKSTCSLCYKSLIKRFAHMHRQHTFRIAILLIACWTHGHANVGPKTPDVNRLPITLGSWEVPKRTKSTGSLIAPPGLRHSTGFLLRVPARHDPVFRVVPIFQLTITLCHSSRFRLSPTVTLVECLPKTWTTFSWPFSTIT